MFDDTTVPASGKTRETRQPANSPDWASAKRTTGEWDPHASDSLRWVARLVRRARRLPPERN